MITITDSAQEIARKIMEASKIPLNNAFRKSVDQIRKETSELIVRSVAKSPEVLSLTNGKLRLDFGFISSPVFVQSLLEAIRQSVIVEFKPLTVVGSSFVGGIKISIIKDDFSDILNLSKSSYTSDVYEIEWLRWLLFEGTDIVVADYKVKYAQGQQYRKGEFAKSRSGGAIMVETASAGYAVPSKFAGTKDNNFITRSLKGLEALISKSIEDIIKAKSRWVGG